jgi:DNA (cytosine-5)-methyltransferase 1
MEEIIEFLGSATPTAALVRGLGYTVDWREIRACTKGTPTIRKRLVIKFRRDGRPITWSQDTHGRPGSPEVKAGKLLPFHTAAECIDWTIEGRSIFDRRRPLAANTCRRVAAGVWRYVLNCANPFIVPLRGTGPDHRFHAGGGNFALVAAHLTEFANASTQRTWRADEPLRTECANVKGGHFALVSAFLEQANGGFYDGDGRSAAEPVSTICASGANQRLVTAYLVKYYGNERDGVSLAEPMHTIPTKDRMGLVQVVHVRQDIVDPALLARAKQCAAFLHEYLPQHFPQAVDLVLVGGYVLVDITLRMLVPRELARAQGFPDSYIIERGLFETAPGVYEWRDITKTDQVRLLGNAVCSDMAEAEIANDLRPLIDLYARAAA